ncbi:hypothetical protein E2C01_045624 [Portunus trituberculatus]|uniref:Uncharacterized protein n=1 Tax=Portunus trituberculatus TaxID=210409 RepID=A0A5B7FWA7_PORTR|nr:hypothetical protein [Portunus trituberculatus]
MLQVLLIILSQLIPQCQACFLLNNHSISFLLLKYHLRLCMWLL